LPSLYQGTVVRAAEPRILNLDPPPHVTPTAQQRYLSFLEGLNRERLQQRPGEDDLAARIANRRQGGPMTFQHPSGPGSLDGQPARIVSELLA